MNSTPMNHTAEDAVVETLKEYGIELVGTLDINGPPSTDDHKKIIEIGRQLSEKIHLSTK